jgi:hypothetical protein
MIAFNLAAAGFDCGLQFLCRSLLGDDTVTGQSLIVGRIGPFGASESKPRLSCPPPLTGREVIVKILANLGGVQYEWNVELIEEIGWTNTRKLKGLRGPLRSRRYDEFFGGLVLFAICDFDTDSGLLVIPGLKNNMLDQGIGYDLYFLIVAQAISFTGSSLGWSSSLTATAISKEEPKRCA